MSRMGALPARPRVGLRSARMLVPLVLGRNHPHLGSILPAALAFVLLTASARIAFAQSWRSYANARFGTVAQVPRDWRAGREPENGDGFAFISPDGQATITVSGGLNIDDSVEQAMSSREQPMEGETITYKLRRGRVLVVSGLRGDRIFYSKSMLSCRDQIWNNVSIEYPAARKAQFDALVTHVAGSLRFGRSAQIPKC
jgi:serine/threonine-protein kinase